MASIAGAQRLPLSATPENYNMTLMPDLKKASFAGEETIKVKLLKSASQIILNSADIEIQDASVASGGASQTATVSYDKENQTATLTVQTLWPRSRYNSP